MGYQAWSVVFGEQPSAAKWNILGTNDASFNDGTGLNTGAVQQQVSTLTGAVASGATTIPRDDTIPQNTEGVQFMTLAITPKAAANILVIEVVAHLASSAANISFTGALFQDSTANALAVGTNFLATATAICPIIIRHTMAAGTTSSTTFKLRAGGDAAGTTTFNGSGAARLYGGITVSSMTIVEYKT